MVDDVDMTISPMAYRRLDAIVGRFRHNLGQDARRLAREAKRTRVTVDDVITAATTIFESRADHLIHGEPRPRAEAAIQDEVHEKAAPIPAELRESYHARMGIATCYVVVPGDPVPVERDGTLAKPYATVEEALEMRPEPHLQVRDTSSRLLAMRPEPSFPLKKDP